MNNLTSCPQTDTVCMSLVGETPAPAIDYIAVSAKPLAGSFEIVAVVAGVLVIMLLLRLLVLWERGQ